MLPASSGSKMQVSGSVKENIGLAAPTGVETPRSTIEPAGFLCTPQKVSTQVTRLIPHSRQRSGRSWLTDVGRGASVTLPRNIAYILRQLGEHCGGLGTARFQTYDLRAAGSTISWEHCRSGCRWRPCEYPAAASQRPQAVGSRRPRTSR